MDSNSIIKPVRTEIDHEAALARIRELWNAKPGTPEYDELDVLVTLVEAYVVKYYPIDPPSSICTAECSPLPATSEDITITLNTYQRDNLLALLHAVFQLGALPSANTGDWIGEIYWMLSGGGIGKGGYNPELHFPNVPVEEMAFGRPK